MTDNRRPSWPPRIQQAKIRRLYESEASGLLDEDLLNEVFIDLVLRCKAMLLVTTAHHGGAVQCPSCSAMIEERDRSKGQEEEVRCTECGWRIVWGDYWRSYRRKQLVAGGTVPVIESFLKEGSRPTGPREKMLLIDRLIHVFHWEQTEQPGRPGAKNLIQDKPDDVLTFLNDLTNSAPRDPVIQRRRAAWQETQERVRKRMRAHSEAVRQRKEKASAKREERERRAASRSCLNKDIGRPKDSDHGQ